MIKAILFDFYGTIAVYGDMQKADEKVSRIIYDCLISKDTSIEYKDFINQWNQIFSLPLTLEEKTEETIFLTKISSIFKQYNIPYNTAEITETGEKCLNIWQSYISFPEDMHKTFEALKTKYTLALISNFDHPKHIRKLLQDTDIIRYFDAIAISGEIGISKPDTRIFQKILKELKLKPNQAVFVGDSIADDITGAQNAGCKTILIDMHNRFQSYSGSRISKISDLIDYQI